MSLLGAVIVWGILLDSIAEQGEGHMAKGDFERKFVEWFRGRNGSDELATCALLVALILVVVNFFIQSIIISVVSTLLMLYSCWRITSKNLEARENETAVFCEFLGPMRSWLRNPAQAAAEKKAYKHLKCPECGQRVRVPRGKGKIRVRCPQCQHKFETRT